MVYIISVIELDFMHVELPIRMFEGTSHVFPLLKYKSLEALILRYESDFVFIFEQCRGQFLLVENAPFERRRQGRNRWTATVSRILKMSGNMTDG